ncbi:hypothetical protein BGX28_007929 [Mortierella sp. GBA30]|nr:hypothetical protein BGX28_007929 [Mortierella sp. GBA30]
MLNLLSASSGAEPLDIIRAALPIGIGLASAVYLTFKIVDNEPRADKSIPMVPLRQSDSTHDAEYDENPDLFLSRCEETYGPVFCCKVLNQILVVVSGPLIKDVFMSEDWNFGDAVDDVSGMHAFTRSFTKTKLAFDDPVVHEVIRETITPNLPFFTPGIVRKLESVIDGKLGDCDRKLIQNPLMVMQEAVASAMITVFLGHELADNGKVLKTFIGATEDLAHLLSGFNRKSLWRTFLSRTEHGLLSPMQKHVQVLVEAAGPIILERRRQEAEAMDSGIEYNRSIDVLQRVLDNFTKYGVDDLEGATGILLILILGSVHSTVDAATYLCYYLAAFPECMEPLYEEQCRVLDEIAKEREEQRQKKIQSSEVLSLHDFKDTELDPEKDRDLSAAAMKRMVRMDSMVREFMRYRLERLATAHMARKDIVLPNGMTIHKGRKVIINTRSVHQDPELQGEDPTEFRPWRFVGKGKAANKASSDYLIFGMGKHACPGRFLAIQEIKTVGAMLVSKYSKIELQDPSKKTQALFSKVGEAVPTGLYFTSREIRVVNDA